MLVLRFDVDDRTAMAFFTCGLSSDDCNGFELPWSFSHAVREQVVLGDGMDGSRLPPLASNPPSSLVIQNNKASGRLQTSAAADLVWM